jgi:predicted nuclease of predicted toxin-antitoxin system
VRLLFDQNISARIVRLLKVSFIDCTQVTLEGLSNARDMDIWQWAQQNDCCIVTYDADFLDIITLRGFPPKVLLLRIGNHRTKELAEIFVQRKQVINDFLADKNIGCLEILL